MESIKYFLYLLEKELGVEPIWIILIIILLILSALYPYHLKGKSITKDNKEGNQETKYFEYKDF